MWLQTRLFLLVAVLFGILYGVIVGIGTWMGAGSATSYIILALGFLGLARVLVEDLMAKGPQRGEGDGVGRRSMLTLAIAAGVLLGALTALAALLPGSELVHALVGTLP